MKIACITFRLDVKNGGGAHHALALRLQTLKDRGHDITLHTFHQTNNELPENTTYAVVRHTTPTKNYLKMQQAVSSFMLQEEKNADILYIDGPTLIWSAGFYKERGGTKPVIIFVNNYTIGMGISFTELYEGNFLKRLRTLLRRKFHIWKHRVWEKYIGIQKLNKVDLILYDSPVVKKIYENFKIHPHYSAVLPDPIEIKDIETAQPKEKDGFSILYTGRLSYDKGVDLLIQAVAPLAEKYNMQVNIVGAGPQAEGFAKTIRDLGLQKYIHLYPWQPRKKLFEFYRNASIFVHPCRWPEPFGLSILEAITFGIPVIASENTGSSWLAGNGAITFTRNDFVALRNQIETLYKNPALRTQMGIQAKKRSTHFDYRDIITRFEKVLDSLEKNNLYTLSEILGDFAN